MVKTKRKHLDALDVQKRSRLPAQEAPTRSLSFTKQESPLIAEEVALPSPASVSQDYSPNLDGNRDPTGEAPLASLSFQGGGHESVANMNPSPLRQDDDTHSDCNSWVEVRKQRVVIIIPPLPKAKPKLPITNLASACEELPQDRSCVKSPSSKVYGKKASNAIRTLKTKSKGNGMREAIGRDMPPISGMDILLASALGTEHIPWQEDVRRRHIDLLASCTQEEASLDTADSSIQPKSSLVTKRAKPVIRNKGVFKLQCKPANSKKLMRPQTITHSKNAMGMSKSQGINNSSVLSLTQSIKVVTLKKHLEKAGGLKGWLCSLGLDQFKEAFGRRSWSERDLLQLEMDDLKEMGKTAVGPRRKLIWAIHHLSQQMI